MYLIWILGSKFYSIKQPIKSNFVGSGHVSHCKASSLYDHLDHCFVVFKPYEKNSRLRKQNQHYSDHQSFQEFSFALEMWTKFPCTCWLWFVSPWRTLTIRSHKSSAGIRSILEPASKDMISDSVEMCETEVCFLHIQLIGTNVWLPKIHNVPPEVDFESSRSPAKSESWYSPNLHCLAVFPTWQYCLYSHVWWM